MAKAKNHEVKHITSQKSESELTSNPGIWKMVTIITLIMVAINLYMTSSIAGNLTALGTNAIDNSQAQAVDQPSPTVAPSQPSQPQAQAPSPTIDMATLADDDDVRGDPNAPVTIVEFSDYECPYCGRFFSQTLGQLEEEYIKTGKVKLIYRDFPLSFHANAQKAAEAAECAGEQGKYYDMHDKLFSEGVSGGVTTFKQYAKDIGLDTAKFDTCLDSGKMASETAKDMQDGAAVGVKGTPGFIINGVLVSGAQPYSVFKEVIDAAL